MTVPVNFLFRQIADDGGNKARGLDSEETEVEELKARGTR